MPYYEKEGKSISFSACKKHISFYVGAEAIEKFALDLNEFVTKKMRYASLMTKHYPQN